MRLSPAPAPPGPGGAGDFERPRIMSIAGENKEDIVELLRLLPGPDEAEEVLEFERPRDHVPAWKPELRRGRRAPPGRARLFESPPCRSRVV